MFDTHTEVSFITVCVCVRVKGFLSIPAHMKTHRLTLALIKQTLLLNTESNR